MSSFGKNGFSSRGMTCDFFKMSGKTLEIEDKLTICVIGTNKTAKQVHIQVILPISRYWSL